MAKIDAVVRSFAAALADERVEEACALLTKSGQEKMTGRHGSCANGARVLSRNVGQLGRRLWRDVKVLNVDGSGDGVVVAHISPRAAPLFEDGVKLRRVSGTWLVDP